MAEGEERPGKAELAVIVLFLAILKAELQGLPGQTLTDGVAESKGILGDQTRRILALRHSEPEAPAIFEDVLYLDIGNCPVHGALVARYLIETETAEIESRLVEHGLRDHPVPQYGGGRAERLVDDIAIRQRALVGARGIGAGCAGEICAHRHGMTVVD